MVQRAWLSHAQHLGRFPPPVIWQDAEFLLTYVKGGPRVGVTSACESVHVCLQSVGVKCLLNHPGVLFFTFSLKAPHSSYNSQHNTVDWFGSLRGVAGEVDLIEFLLQVSIDPIQYQHGFSGLQRHSQYTPLRKSVVQYHDLNGASAAQSLNSNKCGLKDLWRLI